MVERQFQHDELSMLLAALCDATIDDASFARLEQLLATDPLARQLYMTYMDLHGELCWDHKRDEKEVVDGEGREIGESQIPNQQISCPQPLAPSLSSNLSPPVTVIFDDSSSLVLLPSPFYVTHPFVFSNVFAMLVLCIGILGAWLYQIDIPQQIARESRPTAVSTDQNDKRPADHLEFVGRVTSMIDVRWADVQTATINKANVPLGRRYALASGLMEITYDTGAKVVLQGPCTYKVDSRDGGFLGVGKLTARLDNAKSQATTQKSEVRSQKTSLSTIHYPLFIIKTPTATVTDLGTEFTVYVKPDQSSEIYVIRGVVETARDSRTGGKPFRERLVAGEGICVASIEEPPRRMAGGSVRAYSMPPADASVRDVRNARLAQVVLSPSALVATAYGRIWNAKGELTSDDDRKLAFAMVNDCQFGRGENNQRPRSSFETRKGPGARGQESEIDNQQISNPSTCFVGLLYNKETRFDRIKVFLARQTSEGGSWAEMPKLFILKKPVDTNQMPPEEDPADWREIPHQSLYGAFSPDAAPGPGAVFEIALTSLSEEERTGYGWALGGVRGNGSAGYISVTELRAYNTPTDSSNQKNNQ